MRGAIALAVLLILLPVERADALVTLPDGRDFSDALRDRLGAALDRAARRLVRLASAG